MRYKPYLVNDIFLSVQGEGPRIGTPAVFLRFSGCNLNCSFCDTDHEKHTLYGLVSLVEKVVEVSDGMKGIDCVLTGGEPFIQASGDLCYELGKAGFNITLETNASVDFTSKAETLFNVNNVIYNCDYIISSPKNKDYSRWILRNSQCLKLVYPLDFYSDKNVLFDMVSSVEHNSSKRHVDLVLQPMTGFKKEGFSEEESFSEICRDAMAFAQDRYKKFGEAWRIIPQAHVFMGLD